MTTRHAVLGMGGVGGLVAGALARAGHEVTAIVRPEALAGYPPLLSVASPAGSFTAPIRAAASVAEGFDFLWIAVKATQLEAALASVAAPELVAAAIPLLNGIDHLARLRAYLGDARVIPATISVESERVAPGRIERRSEMAVLGVLARSEALLRPSLDALAASGVTARFFDDETTLMWSKLVFLAPLALSTSAALAPLGEVRAQPEQRARLEACVAEACAAALAAGARVDATRVTETLMRLPASFRSSMQKDVAAGQPPELEAIAGPILAGGVDAPATRELVALVRARTIS